MEKIIDLEDRIPSFREKRRKRTNFKFIIVSAIFLFVLLVLIYLQSPLSKIQHMNISGAQLVEEAQYESLANIKIGDSMWDIDTGAVEKNLEELAWVEKATVKRQWLNTVHIEIEEWQKVAYLAKDHTFYPLLENGELLEESKVMTPIDAPVFLQFEDEALLKKLLKELAELEPEVLAMISQINASADTADPYAITLFMNDGYEVRADLTSLASKLNYYPSIVAQIENQEQYEKGIIDIEVGSYYRSYTDEYSIEIEMNAGQDVMEDEE